MTVQPDRGGRPPVLLACATCGGQFKAAATRAGTARFCSVACRAAPGRADVRCRHCGSVFRAKKSEAARKVFCSRACMFAAWSCAWCGKLVPSGRREAGEAACSARCALGLELEAEHERTGVRRAWCPGCEQVLPADAFHNEKANKNGLSVRCKECQRGAYQRNKIEYRRRRFAYEAAEPARSLPFTQQQQDARWSMWGGRCWQCGVADATEEDHVKPLSAGGTHCLANLRPACKPCNASKHGDWPLEAEHLRANFRHPDPRPGSDIEQRTPRRPRQEHTCAHCGTVRLIPACYADTQRYCSRKCQYAARKRPRITKTCIGCGVEFGLPGHEASEHRKFCTTTCAYTSGKRRTGRPRRSSPGDGQAALW